jgi:DNA-binding transcriptional LysR family regulator
MLDPRHLRVLIEVARHGSYAAAARALGYTQPAIGQQIHTLERHLRTRVTYRSGRRVLLTEAGELLVRHAHGILNALQATEDGVAEISGLRRGTARAMVSGTAMRLLVAGVLSRLGSSHPGLQLSIAEAHSRQSLDALRAGEVEFAIGFVFPGALASSPLVDIAATGRLEDQDLAGLVQVPLFSDFAVVAVPSDHRIARAGRAQLADLEDEPLIAGGLPLPLASSAMGKSAVSLARIATNDLWALHDLIAGGHGIAMLASTSAQLLTSESVVACPIVPAIRRRHVALTHPDLTGVQSVAACLEAVQAAAVELRTTTDSVE